MAKPIKTGRDYEDAVAAIEAMMARNPQPDTPEADELEVLAILVEEYEKDVFPIEPPAPVDAILFRMEQENLQPRDLLPYIGSRSKVSEVLARKRPLTLSMIRALHSGLGIPLKALLHDEQVSGADSTTIEWDRFPIREMVKRGWISKAATCNRDTLSQSIRQFIEPVSEFGRVCVLYRERSHVRSARPMDRHALLAWTARVVRTAQAEPLREPYEAETVTLEFMRQVARLSRLEDGPVAARRFLERHGIRLVVEPHLPRTYLDGAAITGEIDHPIIALTLRYDRLDNFWYCLMHELAHLALHSGQGVTYFYDDLDVGDQGDAREAEADNRAGEALIPADAWKKSAAALVRSPQAAHQLANALNIHPAIVAGRMRHAFNDYRILNNLVGHGQVRTHFLEARWGE